VSAPGPWRVAQMDLHHRSESGSGIAVVDADGFTICDNQTYYPHPLDPANAHTIAAAPDLLEACREALKWPDEDEYGNAMEERYATPGYRAYRDRLRAAIAKAEGR
jgi:hypothetical protein